MVYLVGDLGAGKTTLARGFLRDCGIVGPVRSPTYTLVQVYQSGAQTLLHLDLYRLRDAAELEHLGLSEWAQTDCLWLIEWPQHGGDLLPPADLVVTLVAGPDQHQARIDAETPAGAAWLSRMMADRPFGARS